MTEPRLVNWFDALFIHGRPWHYNWRALYRDLRRGYDGPLARRIEPMGRLRAAWHTLSFPHIHREEMVRLRLIRQAVWRRWK